MRSNAPNLSVWMMVVGLLFPIALAAQTVTLSGTATDVKGKPIANATVSLKPAQGSVIEARTDAEVNYTFSNLAPGDYMISASGDGMIAKPVMVTVSSVSHQTEDVLLETVPGAQKPGQELPNAPSAAPPSSSTQPSLEDLGFPAQQTQGNAQLQARLEKRTRMLRIHQKLGLITVIPMAAALITGPMAKVEDNEGRSVRVPTTANLDFHAALGGLTTAMYFTTAYYAVFAPGVPGNPKHGGIRWHEALAMVHGPGMVLTPILGAMAYNQENSGKKPHGIAAQHGTVAWITSLAYGTSIVAVSWPIHWKFWENK